MLKLCGQAVERAGTTSRQAQILCPQSTGWVKYLTSQVFFVRSLSTAFRYCTSLKTQAIYANFNLLFSNLCTLTTGPNTTNKLIRGITL